MRSVRSLVNSSPIPYVGSSATLQLAMPRSGGREAQMRTYETVSTVFAIVNRTAETTAQYKWCLYRKPTSAKGERTEVREENNLALWLWNHPNKFMTGSLLREAVQQHLDLVGEGWIVIGRNPGVKQPASLWPVRPDKMSPVQSKDDYISGYVYSGPNGEKIPLGLDEVIFIRRPNPLDPYRGMGPVQSAMVDMDASKYSAEWNRNFFLNSAEPGGIIEFDHRLSETEFDDFSKRWNEGHKGVNAAHRVGILEMGKWVDRKYTQRDMQFAELRDISRELIREAFGFPKPMLGAVDDVNRANAEAGEVIFARWLAVPRLNRWKDVLNTQYLKLFGQEKANEFDYPETVVPPDREADTRDIVAKTNGASVLVLAGYDGKDVSKAMGLPDMKWSRPTQGNSFIPSPGPGSR
jgi:HK97 family phage portal protein